MPDSTKEALYADAMDVLCTKLVEDERRIGAEFPYVTARNGQWALMSASRSAGYTGEQWDHGNWFCGFWVGLLLAAHLHSRNERFLELARDRMALVAQRATDGNTHDIGFIFLSSAVPMFRVTGDSSYREHAVAAADRLRARLIATRSGAYLSSWGPLSDPRARASSAIDTMANIPLLYWAARERGDASYQLAAEAHARATHTSFVREDRTLFHAVEYDPVTGSRRRGYTFQGYSDESSWSRGTGWAVYGLAASGAATGDRWYLDRAAELAEKWLDQLGDRVVPPWDFDDPSPDAPEDSSASAIMAAALLDLAALHPDAGQQALWNAAAHRLLRGLCEGYLAREATHRGLLKHGCYSRPHNVGTDAAVMFGDYYFVEALARVLAPGQLVDDYVPIET